MRIVCASFARGLRKQGGIKEEPRRNLRASGEKLEATEKCKNVKMQPCNHKKKVKHGGKSMKN